MVCGDNDTWWPIVVENRSPALITSWENTGWAKNISIPGKLLLLKIKRLE